MSISLAKKVLQIEANAIRSLADRLDRSFETAVEIVAGCRGRIVVTGMGKSGIVGRKIAATLNSTGTPSLFLNPAEAVHGDLGMIVTGDVVIALSNSGKTRELLTLVEPIKRLTVPLIALSGDSSSTLAEAADVVLDVSVSEEACPMGLAPTASTTASLALGDALAMAVLEKKGFGEDDFRNLHPRGQIGFKLLRVEDIMHRGEELPLVGADAPMKEVLYEMSRKGLGVTSVVDELGKLVGIISDGDLRRHLEQDGELLSKKARDCMTTSPVTLGQKEAATAALALMEKQKITCLVVPDDEGRALGVVHLHDLWRLGEYF